MNTIKTLNVNEVLDNHIPKLTKMVAEGYADAILICGDAGVGKTYGAEKFLNQYAKENPNFKWVMVGGDISPIGLYQTLYEYKDSVLLCDDVDALLSSRCANILKNALNTKEDRVVSYKKMNRQLFNAKDMSEEQKYQKYLESERTMYPNSFQFNGSCIFISNKPLDYVEPAVRDRCLSTCYLDFDLEQIVKRIIFLIDKLNPIKGNLERNDKFEVLQYLYNSAKKKGMRLSLRNFRNALSYRTSFSENNEWQEMIDLYLN